MLVIEWVIKKYHIITSRIIHEITSNPLLVFLKPSFILCTPRTVAIICPVMTSYQRDSIASTIIVYLSNKHIGMVRSEEHTSELQSRQYLVCRLLLEKK